MYPVTSGVLLRVAKINVSLVHLNIASVFFIPSCSSRLDLVRQSMTKFLAASWGTDIWSNNNNMISKV